MGQSIGIEGWRNTGESTAVVGQGAVDDVRNLVRFQRVQGEDPTAGEQRRVDFKRRVFGGRADESDGSVFHVGQNHILLGLVEAVDFIHEKDGLPLVQGLPFPGLCYRPTEIGDAGGDGADGLEMGAGYGGDQSGKGGFSGSRRPPQQDGRNAVGVDGTAQYFAFAQDMLLAHKLIEAGGAHPLGQGRDTHSVLLTAMFEQGFGVVAAGHRIIVASA